MENLVYLGQGAYLNSEEGAIYLADSDGHLSYLCTEEAFVAMAALQL